LFVCEVINERRSAGNRPQRGRQINTNTYINIADRQLIIKHSYRYYFRQTLYIYINLYIIYKHYFTVREVINTDFISDRH